MTDFELGNFLPFRLVVLAGQLSRDFSQHYAERFGLSRQEWRVLAHLWRTGPASVGDIHRLVDLDKSRVSRAAASLEAAGHLRREEHPTDRRLVHLSVTESGHVMMMELSELAKGYQHDLMARLGPEADQFLKVVDRLWKTSDV
ncbi:MarR family winged helix-turn-helix transcriptional regulator [Tropicimonas sp. IMCC34043]|uniref:MarR family winged helix-turn-helix transcriptional regulator n=1 Tax=Tropicimonas sp. IMCC34043 TaxID=2248760 RepID=UPI000E233289|nr:MarR family transcriptional regulator [Tropicimonas sp. IMCC34043]